MLRFASYKRPETLEEAYAIIQRSPRARVLGGGAWLRLGRSPLPVAVDLTDCHVDAIEEAGESWRIGAYATLRQMERHEGLNASCAGVLARSVERIVGVQFRAGATVGGSVFGRFGFSDVCCALLALGAEVEFAGAGRMPLAGFLAEPGRRRDVLACIYVPRRAVRAGYADVRRAATDIPVLNACAVLDGAVWRVAVGARPGRARLVAAEAGDAAADAIAEAVAALPFGGNMWASAAYRAQVAPVLARRAMQRALGADPAPLDAAGEGGVMQPC